MVVLIVVYGFESWTIKKAEPAAGAKEEPEKPEAHTFFYFSLNTKDRSPLSAVNAIPQSL